MNLKKSIALTVASVAFAMAQQVAPAAPAAAPEAAPAPAAAPTAQVSPAPEQVAPQPAPEAQPAPAPAEVQPAPQETAVQQQPQPAEVPPAPPVQEAPAPENKAPAQTAEAAPAPQPPAPPAPDQTAAAPQPVAGPGPMPGPVPGPDGAPVRMGPPKTPFTVLHGNAYNRVSNEAAGDNVDALLNKRLTKMAFNKFFYVEPSGEKGAFSLGGFFGAMDISGDVGRATAGYATPGFAAELRLGMGVLKSENDGSETKKITAGDDWGLTLSKTIGGYNVTLAGDWNTYADEVKVDPKKGPKIEQHYRDIGGSLIVTDGPSARLHFWSAGVAFTRHENELEVGGKLTDPTLESNFTIVPIINYGTPALRTSYANLYLGLNTTVPVTIFDDRDIRDTTTGRMFKAEETTVALNLAPNILGEVLLTESLMVFGEASYNWEAFRYVKSEGAHGEEKVMKSTADKVDASMGLRYQYKNWAACEFAFGDSFFTDTKSIFNGEGVFVSFGGFIYF